VKRRAAVVALALLGSSCGYALVGKGVTSDPSIRRIGVPMFRDGTGRAGLDQKVTQRVIEELLKRGRFDVVQESAGVDAVVDGELISYVAVPIGFSDEGGARTQPNRYSVTLTARVRYAKPGQTEAIWENEAFAFRDEYDVADDPSAFFNQEEQALDRLSTQFARSLVAAMLEAF
jgi:Lipopolysaccharide-assembly